MFKAFQSMLHGFQTLSDPSSAQSNEQVEGLNHTDLLSVALMVEIARADHDLADTETTQIKQTIEQNFALDSNAAQRVYNHALELAQDNHSLHNFTQHVKALEYNDRLQLFQQLWQTAYADQEISPNEEAMLRKIADLLYISHADYIRQKLTVVGDQ